MNTKLATPIKAADPYIDKELVEHLAGLVEEAKKGELVAYAAALQYRGEYWSHGYHLRDKKASVTHLIGVLQMLVTKLCHEKVYD